MRSGGGVATGNAIGAVGHWYPRVHQGQQLAKLPTTPGTSETRGERKSSVCLTADTVPAPRSLTIGGERSVIVL
jgi:hypothetical protein